MLTSLPMDRTKLYSKSSIKIFDYFFQAMILFSRNPALKPLLTSCSNV